MTTAPCGHASWVSVPLKAATDEIAHPIAVSDRLVRSSLTRKVQATPPRAPDAAG
ncbi:hypothetical protein [Loktanella sp. M215]|uniref:hypothetical protein n=1 Tax=Loktanella sp. M215 TaxID=2675431 RepID=UPI001F442220|nr:hypothetical protein [Loktanella sp. M215]MCF7700164.1 hypothetical protein [Loktanella sp. M215]